MKKIFACMLALAMFGTLIAGCGGSGKDDKKPAAQKFINIATGGTAGTYFPLGGAVADILNKNIPGANASAQSTGASVANINLLQQGKVDLAFVQNDIAYYAVNGVEMFKDKKVAGLKGLATLYPETVQIVTIAKSGVTSIDQLKGKRVAVGAAGSGTEANARQILGTYGITYDDIKVQYLSFGEASDALKDGNIDVAFVTAGHPTAAIQDIATQQELVLLPMAADKADALIAKYPFYAKVTIPAKSYRNQAADVSAVAVMAMLVVTDKMDAQLTYDISKAIFTNTDRLKAAHAVAANVSKANGQVGMSIPVASGAEKYFKEK